MDGESVCVLRATKGGGKEKESHVWIQEERLLALDALFRKNSPRKGIWDSYLFHFFFSFLLSFSLLDHAVGVGGEISHACFFCRGGLGVLLYETEEKTKEGRGD